MKPQILAKFVAIVGIVILTVLPRLYHINFPVADWHSFRQSDTAAVARNFTKFGLHPLYPRYDDLSNIQSGKDNPMGWRMVEFPLYQTFAVLLSRLASTLPIEVWLRFVTIAAAAGTAVLLVLLTTPLTNLWTGFAVGFIYALLPYSIYFGRTILPETLAVFFAMLSLWFVQQLGDDRARRSTKDGLMVILSALSAALALLVKPPAGFLLMPVIVFFWRRFKFSLWFIVSGIVYAAITLAPLLWWRRWILQFPEGIPAFEWLLNSNGIRLKGAWFQWLFAERLGQLMLGYWGLIPFGLGLLTVIKKGEWVFRWLLIGSLGYLIVFATGNVQHDYYQILLLPVVSIYAGKGLIFLLTHPAFPKITRIVVGVLTVLFMWAFSWYTLRTYYWINRPDIVEAGKLADTILPKDAKVIAPYNGDTTFLYQTNRQGWPLGFDIDKKIAMGATTYVTVSPTDADWETKELSQKYTVLVRNDRYAIIDLTRKR